MTHLFLFTLTPVQSFIAQARKTQDLWAGSRMLSDLIGKVFDKIDKEGGQVIFPSQKSDSLPNRILAEFDLSQNTDLQAKGQEIVRVIDTELERLRKKAEAKIGAAEYAIIKDAFENQLKNYFSTFWVFVPFETDYQTTYDNADRLLGAVKNSRTFTQNPEKGRKCSLSGEQNALVFNKAPLPSFANNVVQIKSDMIDDKEGLSAISSIKRFYPFNNQRKSFDSTTDIALLKSIQDAPQAFKDFEDIFDILKAAEQEKCLKLEGKDWKPFNEQFFYEDNLTHKQIPCKQQLDIVKKAHKKLREAIKKQEELQKIKIPFTKYYAILLFDADSMGAWLSGDYLTDKNQLYDFHKHVSGLLSGFADYAKNYVDGDKVDKYKKGRTVYAGGDDYLGFVNLHYLFEVMKHLREQFKEQVSDKISDSGKYQIRESKEMTFSAGISIAHYKTPLSEVLTWARKMEKEAKDTDNKDSFGMAVLKHSGEIHKTVLGFKDNHDKFFSDNLQTIIDYLSDKKFSSNFITNLEREMLFFDDSFDYRRRIIKSESKRLIERSRNKQKGSKEESDHLSSILLEIFDVTSNRTDLKDNHFHTTLGICDFINRKLQSNG